MESRSPCRLASVAQLAGVVLHEHVRDRLPQVPEEPLGDLQAVDHAAGQHGQQRQQIVAAPLRNSSRIRGVQFCEPISQLSMCVETSVLPGRPAARRRR